MKPPTNKDFSLTPILAGVAGEYFVAAELSRRGFISSLTLKNTRGMDILVANQDASRTITVQCKTNQNGKKIWLLNKKGESFHSPTHFYVFVSLGDPCQRPAFHIVPSKVVADFITQDHREWLEAPGKKGQQRKDSSIRTFYDTTGEYLERWDLLAEHLTTPI